MGPGCRFVSRDICPMHPTIRRYPSGCTRCEGALRRGSCGLSPKCARDSQSPGRARVTKCLSSVSAPVVSRFRASPTTPFGTSSLSGLAKKSDGSVGSGPTGRFMLSLPAEHSAPGAQVHRERPHARPVERGRAGQQTVDVTGRTALSIPSRAAAGHR